MKRRLFTIFFVLSLLLETVVTPSVLASANSMAKGERVPLRVDVPKPSSAVFHTSQHIKEVDVEWPTHPEKAGLTVPVGTTNVARGMAVSSNVDAEPTLGTLALLTDGEKHGTEECVLGLPPGLYWVQIDLRASTPVFAVALWHAMLYDRAYRDVIVRVSDDPEFARGVRTIFNNDADDSAGFGKGTEREYADTAMGKLIDAKGVRARYVRVYANGSRLKGGAFDRQTHWTEIEVYGTPTDEGRAIRENHRAPPATRSVEER